MQTLLEPAVLSMTIERLSKLEVTSVRRWGTMSSHQAVCHLGDSFLLALGERDVKEAPPFVPRSWMKRFALRAPMKWPRNLKTLPEVDQRVGGTRPVEFELDRQKLIGMLERFSRQDRDFAYGVHPIFGVMTEWEWMRWGYLHMDHHLRQFGL